MALLRRETDMLPARRTSTVAPAVPAADGTYSTTAIVNESPNQYTTPPGGVAPPVTPAANAIDPPFQPSPSTTIDPGTPPPQQPAPAATTTPPPAATPVAQAPGGVPSIADTLKTVNDAINSTLSRLTPAQAAQAAAATGTVNPETETVQGQLKGLLKANNPIMRMAYQKGLANASERGLLNSSLAGKSGQEALYEAAVPIAGADASAYRAQAQLNQQSQQQSNIANAQLKTQANVQNSQAQAEVLRQAVGVLGDTALAGYAAQTQAATQFRQAYYNADEDQRKAVLNDWANNAQFTRNWNQNERSAFLNSVSEINDLRWKGEQANADRDNNSRIASENRNVELTSSLINAITTIGSSGASPDQQAAAMKQIFPVFSSMFEFYNGVSTIPDVDTILRQLAGQAVAAAPGAIPPASAPPHSPPVHVRN